MNKLSKIVRFGSRAGGLVVLLLLGGPASAQDYGARTQPNPDETYDKQTIITAAEEFFGDGAEGLGTVLEKVFSDLGRPNAYIKGQEAGAAIAVGVRYGDGTLILKNGTTAKVHWKGPSIGFDLGANASRTFILVYSLPAAQAIFRRFPGVEGSLYFVAGLGVTYMRAGGMALAPIRLGVGWRQGANVGYMHFTPEKSWVPF
ncbi:MAG: DUF1134 domain-containing protein [Gammaproteobacteria bacterium]|nr:DUF1134 domain-containing protein [Gammaproteobacteria bacterium]